MKFDLEQAIAAWRQRMLAVGITAPVPMEELEEHLREEIERLMESGMELEAALSFAIEKLGKGCALREEFGKEPAPRKSTMGDRIFCALTMILLLCLTVHDLYELPMDWAWRAAYLGFLALMTALIPGSLYADRLYPFIKNRVIRKTVGISFWVSCQVGGSFLSGSIIYFETQPGPEHVIFLWAVALMMTGLLVYSGLETRAKRFERRQSD